MKLFILFLMTLVLVGCGGSSKNTNNDDNKKGNRVANKIINGSGVNIGIAYNTSPEGVKDTYIRVIKSNEPCVEVVLDKDEGTIHFFKIVSQDRAGDVTIGEASLSKNVHSITDEQYNPVDSRYEDDTSCKNGD